MRAGGDLVARRERARALPEVIRPAAGAGAGLAPERREDPPSLPRGASASRTPRAALSGMARSAGKARARAPENADALLAENARGVARKGGGVALVCEHDEPISAQAARQRPRGGKAGGPGAPLTGHASRRRPEDPRLDPPEKTQHRGRGGERLKQRALRRVTPGIMAEARTPWRRRPGRRPTATRIAPAQNRATCPLLIEFVDYKLRPREPKSRRTTPC